MIQEMQQTAAETEQQKKRFSMDGPGNKQRRKHWVSQN